MQLLPIQQNVPINVFAISAKHVQSERFFAGFDVLHDASKVAVLDHRQNRAKDLLAHYLGSHRHI
jgi:hypothetical protein